MKLIRFGLPGKEKPGLLINDVYYDVSGHLNDYDEAFFTGDGLSVLAAIDVLALPVIPRGFRLGPPVSRPSKILCVGLNYAQHARETGANSPTEPVLFMKSTTAIVGPNDAVTIPEGSLKTDWEVELAIVMGKRASYVKEEEVMQHIAGYCLHNDVSERAYQLERGGTWDKGKGCDTFAPLGPWLVTTDEIPDPHQLRLWLTVNGNKMQDGNTNDFIFNIPQMISYISRFMTLLPGDIISTGTPAGVAMGMPGQPYLRPGDLMELGIDGLGTAKQLCVAYSVL